MNAEWNCRVPLLASKMVKKTVIILAASVLMRASSGRMLVVDLNTSKGGPPKSAAAGGSTGVASFSKTAWTCSVEAVCEYSRLVFDLFPHQCQVCLVVCDPVRCNAVNSWRDEDQDLSKVLEGFQTFGPPQGCNHGDEQAPGGPLGSALQGLGFGLTCLAQLTAPQFARVQNDPPSVPPNGGRVILVTALSSPGDAAEVRRRFVEQYWRENATIDQLLNRSRLPIKECDFVLVNVGTPSPHSMGPEAAEKPLPPGLTFAVHNIAADQLHSQIIALAQSHFDLATTTVTGIPMKEDQSGGNSANYDVKLYHSQEAHRDILRAGRGLQSGPSGEKGAPKNVVALKWSTPKPASGLEMMLSASAYRVTPAEVTSRPTVCLVNFLLSGRAVVLEQPRKPGAVRVASHMLISHGGAIFLHALLQGKSPLEEPPSMTEGLGGRITDYRISDFVELMGSCRLVPHPLDRTLLPQPTSLDRARSQQERCTRVWPLVFSETVLWSLQQELNPLTKCVPEQSISADDYEQCRQIIVDLQNRENSSESLPLLQSGAKPKASRREEQYRQLWEELEDFLHAHHGNSERHAKLFDLVQVLSKESPSNGRPRKQPMRALDYTTEAMDVEQTKVPAVAQMTLENSTSQAQSEQPVRPLPLPSGAKPISLLSLWSARTSQAGRGKHKEFAGRVNCSTHGKAELYTHLTRSYL